MSENLTSYAYYPIDTFKSILSTVQHCEAVCENTFTAVLGMCDGQRATQLQLLRDCADICSLTAKYIARCSSFAKHQAHLCAMVCEMCGNHCLMHPDPQSQYCGRVCLECAKECAAFSGMGMAMPGMTPTMPGMAYPGTGMFSQPEKKDDKK